MKNIIIGAGISGLNLAYHLEKNNNKDYVLIESSPEVGGLFKNILKDEFIFELGIHLIHPNEETTPLVKDLLRERLILKDRKAGILLKNKIAPYPFQYNLYHLDENTKKECLNGAIEAAKNFDENKTPNNFEEWVHMTLGEGIANHFMKPYNKKAYCIDPKELSVDFVGKYTPRPNIKEIIQGANSDMSNLDVGYHYKFYHVEDGRIDRLPQAMAKKIQNLKLKEKLVGVNPDKKIAFTNNSDYSFSNLISTLPINKFVDLIDGVPEKIRCASEKLRFNNVCVVLLGINRPNIFSHQWLYLPQEDVLPYRISFPMNYSEKMAPPGTSSICAEYSYVGEKRLSDEEIINRTIKDLIKIGIIKEDDEIILKDIIDLGHSYVIFDSHRNDNLELIQNYLRKKDIYSIGRFGTWAHFSMEDGIIQGRKLALELIEKNKNHF